MPRLSSACFATSLVFAAAIWSAESAAQSTDQRPGFSNAVGKVIAVELDSHRVVTGAVDERTNGETLWLRTSTNRVTLWSGYPASRVVRYDVVAEVDLSKSAGDNNDVNEASPCDGADCEPFDDSSPVRRRRIVAVEVLAEAANFDQDVEIDGLRVSVRAVDQYGETVAVDGRADFTLLGERRDWRGGRHELRRPQFIELQRWSQQIRSGSTTLDGVHANLEFRNFHPNRELDVAEIALLHVRLNVPGQGVFSASDDRLVLRRWSPFRDDLQQATGRRYLRQEQTWIDLPR